MAIIAEMFSTLHDSNDYCVCNVIDLLRLWFTYQFISERMFIDSIKIFTAVGSILLFTPT